MSHIHLPDGALPGGVVLFGLLGTCALLVLATRQIRRNELLEYMPRMAFVSAILLIVMSVPLGALPIHANLGVLAGVMLGPWLAIFSAFTVNLFLAFIGHGTTAMVGINTLVLAAEMIIGFLLVRYLVRIFSRHWAGAVAVVLTLALTGTMVFWGLNNLGVDIEAMVHHDHTGEHAAAEDSHQHESGAWWALPLMVLLFVAPSVAVETVLTFLVIRLLARVRPQLIEVPSQGRA